MPSLLKLNTVALGASYCRRRALFCAKLPQEFYTVLFRSGSLEYHRPSLILQDGKCLPEKPLVHPVKVLRKRPKTKGQRKVSENLTSLSNGDTR